MLCMRHDWFDAETPCPRCEPPAPEPETVTAAETPDDGLDIPPFLLRNKDNTFAHPEALPCANPSSTETRSSGDGGKPLIPDVLMDVAQDQLLMWVDNPYLTLLDRQPIYRELQRRVDKVKSYERIEKLKASKAEKGE